MWSFDSMQRITGGMNKTDYYKLENGSDIRGVAMEGIEGEHVNLTKEAVCDLAKSFVHFLAGRIGKPAGELRVAVGHDSRLSAEDLKAAVIEGLTETGAAAVDCGLSSTPAMFMATVLPGLRVDGSIMITASHLPFNRNGMKFFTREGGLEHEDIRAITTFAMEGKFGAGVKPQERQAVECCALLEHYSGHLRNIIREALPGSDRPLTGLHIVVDAGNGAGGFFESMVLKPLGADTSGSVYLEPDGHFPNHIPNPENAAAMEAVRRATVASHADLGLIFDTDVDRAAVVFANGDEINRNAIIALMGAIVAREHPGSVVVTDSVTSDELTVFLEQELGLKHHRFKRGYRNVINESIRLNKEGTESWIAMETSGHGALKENYFLDDGAYLCVKILIELARCKAGGQAIEALIEKLGYPAETAECRLKIGTEAFRDYGEGVLAAFGEFVSDETGFEKAPVNYEGIRVNVDREGVHGWLLLRMSLHDPIMPLNIETKEDGGVTKIKQWLAPFFEKFDKLKGNCSEQLL